MNTIKINKNKTQMIAHRGLSMLEKENTMAAFIAAGNRTYFGIECDIHPTIDGKFVVVHDDNLKRVSGVDLNVEKSTLRQIQEINLNNKFNDVKLPYLKVPTLEEYLECCIKYEKKCVIEFKNPFTKENIIKVIKLVNSYNYLNNCIFISFYINNLLIVREYNKTINVQYLLDKYDDKIIKQCIIDKIDIDINYKSIDENKIKYLHQNGLKINVWTVNDKSIAEKLCAYGVDFITSDCLE